MDYLIFLIYVLMFINGLIVANIIRLKKIRRVLQQIDQKLHLINPQSEFAKEDLKWVEGAHEAIKQLNYFFW